MSIAKAAAKAMLSDALLQDGPGINRINHLELELPLDKVIKFVTVGLPMMLVCMAFAREISLGEQLFVSILEFCIPLVSTPVTLQIFRSAHLLFCGCVLALWSLSA